MGEYLVIIVVVGGAALFLVRRWLTLRSGKTGCGCGCGNDCASSRAKQCQERAD